MEGVGKKELPIEDLCREPREVDSSECMARNRDSCEMLGGLDVEYRRSDRRMFDINKFLYKLMDRSKYTSIFKSKSKREPSARVTGRFEALTMVFTRASRIFRARGMSLLQVVVVEQRTRGERVEAG